MVSSTWTQYTGSKFRVRFVIRETAGTGQGEMPSMQLQYRKDTGGGFGSWSDIGVDVTPATSVYANDGDALTQVIGTGTFTDGRFSTDGLATSSIATVGNDEFEFEYCLQLDSGTLNGGDQIELRLFNSQASVLDVYSVTPSITVTINDFIVTEATDTASLSGTVSLPTGASGSFDITDVIDVAALSGDITIQGTTTPTETKDAMVFSGAVTIQGTLAKTGNADTLLFSGAVTQSNSFAVTESTDTADFVLISNVRLLRLWSDLVSVSVKIWNKVNTE